MVKPINQSLRSDLCRTILTGGDSAVIAAKSLAQLYYSCGYRTIATALESGPLHMVQSHARVVLGR
jgi:hypothetical protein